MSRTTSMMLLGLILLGSLLLNVYNTGYGVGFHPDEVKKAIFVEKNIQDFKHPIAMLQVSRILTAPFEIENRDVRVVIGRIINGVFGVGIVWVSYLLARLTLSRKLSLLVAGSVAVSPILVVHAHYFKEDIFFTFFGLLALWLFLKHSSLWGISLGLTLSSHYKSALLVPLLTVFSFSKVYRRVWLPTMICAAAIFVSINYPILTMWETFQEGVLYEADHAVSGHNVKHYIWDTFGTFHFVNSLWPGMTPLAAVLSVMAIVYLIISWRKLSKADYLILSFVMLYYAVMELSPLKPGPDYSRYVLPVVPGLIYVVFRSFDIGRQALSIFNQRVLFAILIVGFIIWPLVDSIRYDYNLGNDTRVQLQQWMREKGIQENEMAYEAYTSMRVDTVKIWSHYTTAHNVDEFQAKGVKYVIASSFQYERYQEGSEEYEGYQELFEFPYMEIQPAFKSFGFSNPTLRVVDVGL